MDFLIQSEEVHRLWKQCNCLQCKSQYLINFGTIILEVLAPLGPKFKCIIEYNYLKMPGSHVMGHAMKLYQKVRSLQFSVVVVIWSNTLGDNGSC